MALVLDRAVKAITGTSLVDAAATIPDVTVADLATAKAEARPAIQALRDLGVSNVANFDPKANVSRGQFASFLYRTAQLNAELTVKAIEVVDATTLKVTLSNGSVHTVTLEKALEANVETEVKFTIDGKEYTAKVTYKVDAAVVTSVKAVNAVTVEVKFSVPVSATDAKLDGKVAIAGVTFDAAQTSLSSDGLTLTLKTKNSAKIEVTNATVVVEEIATKADSTKKTAKYVGLITYKDEVAPLIDSVSAKTNGKPATEITVKFTEPVANFGVVRVNGVVQNNITSTGDTITIKGLNLDVTKSHTVEVFNILDYANNNTVSDSKTFTITVDTVAPTATVTAVSDNAVLVKFDKKMDVDSVIKALVSGFLKSETLDTVTTDAATVVAGSGDTEFLVKISSSVGDLFSKDATRTFTAVLSGNIEDSLDNKFVATNKTVTLTKDTVKPTATGYSITKNADGEVTGLVVSFSEELAASGNSGSLAANTLFSSIATVVNTTGQLSSELNALVSQAVEEGDKEITFKFPTAKKLTGTLAVQFAANIVSDLARTPNKNATFGYNVEFGSGTTTSEFTIAANSAVVNSSGDTITLTFPEAVKGGNVTGSATATSSYTLDGKPLPAGTTILINNTNEPVLNTVGQTIVTIKLPAGTIEKDLVNSAVLRVSGVQNLNGTKTVVPYAQTVTIYDNVAPKLVSAIVVDNTTIELTYNENVKIASDGIAVDSFVITGGTNNLTYTVDSAAEVGGFGTKVRLTFVGTQLVNDNQTYTVETVNKTTFKSIVTDAAQNKNEHEGAIKVTAPNPKPVQ
jgi:hypothetical protein